MSRLLFLIAIVIVVYLIFRSFRKNTPPQDKPVVDEMVRCAHCGVHLPKGESIQGDGQFFCCVEHRDAQKK
ncbi:MAG: PP0621 family protein [Gallionella sp.]|nr:PP0621 family protein [Gallionella sp.]MDH4286102.1 PP0621 family protein [Gallionella sp.]